MYVHVCTCMYMYVCMLLTILLLVHVHTYTRLLFYDIRVIPCAQLREAVKYSFFLDSYNASDTENYTTDTGNVSTCLICTIG